MLHTPHTHDTHSQSRTCGGQQKPKKKSKASSIRSVETTRRGMGAAKKGGDDSDGDDEDEQEAAARSLQEVDLMHHGFNRGDLAAAMFDDYGRSLSESERLIQL